MPISAYGILSNLPYLKKVAAHMRGQQIEIFNLQREIKELHERRAAENFTPRYGDRLREFAKLLRPQRVVGHGKIRLGNTEDGGYVMLNDFEGIPRAYSLGVGPDVSFDVEIANKGIDVLQFDHTVPHSPTSHARFTHYKKEIKRVEDFLVATDKKQLLKIDIEGSEWDVLDAATPDDLSHFGQILGEFHSFDRFHDPKWAEPALRALKKLNETHQLIHIHGNNCSPSFWYGEMQWPFALELSYVIRSGYQFEPTTELFPGELDTPNWPGRPDYILDGLFKS